MRRSVTVEIRKDGKVAIAFTCWGFDPSVTIGHVQDFDGEGQPVSRLVAVGSKTVTSPFCATAEVAFEPEQAMLLLAVHLSCEDIDGGEGGRRAVIEFMVGFDPRTCLLISYGSESLRILGEEND